jgi:hypothetical protein
MKLNIFRVSGGRCQAECYSAWQRPPDTRPTTFHVWETRGCQWSFRLLMMGGVSPEKCWALYKYGIIKILIHRCILLDFSLWILKCDAVYACELVRFPIVSLEFFIDIILDYWMTLRKGEDILIWKGMLWIAVYGEFALEKTLDLSWDRLLNEWMNEWMNNPSGRTMTLWSTQPLTEMSTNDVSWGLETVGA